MESASLESARLESARLEPTPSQSTPPEPVPPQRASARESPSDVPLLRWFGAPARRGPLTAAATGCGRGPQRKATKVLVSLRLSRHVLAHFRRTGAGWQTRIDALLRYYVAVRGRRERLQALMAAEELVELRRRAKAANGQHSRSRPGATPRQVRRQVRWLGN